MSGARQQPTGRSRPTWWLWGLVGGVVVAGVGGGLIGAAVASPSSRRHDLGLRHVLQRDAGGRQGPALGGDDLRDAGRGQGRLHRVR